MKLLLVRHGNTFEAGETPVRVGAKEDLALTAAGEVQARALADQMTATGLLPDAYVTGPLQRTRRHCELIAEALNGGPPVVDDRLTEIDYGPWGGLSDAEISIRFGPGATAELDAWNRESRWPRDTVTWRPDPETISKGIRALTMELERRLAPDGIALICSSNGVLRYALEMTDPGLAGHLKEGRAKMATGAASLLEVRDGRATVLFWNTKAGKPLSENSPG